jgi:HSP20 family molecular chaperone IbpA
MTMRNYDFAPLYRATVGFDRIANLMDRALSADVGQPTYPPYNIEKTAEDAYRISVAVAGFAADELNVEVKDGALIMSASPGPPTILACCTLILFAKRQRRSSHAGSRSPARVMSKQKP